MGSRVAIALAASLLGAGALVTSVAARQPPVGTAMYVVQNDSRRCASPRCGGYWVAIANGVRTRCSDGQRRPRCYVARARTAVGRAVGTIPPGTLVRGVIDDGLDGYDVLLVRAAYTPAGTAPPGGGYYRVVDNGTRCVRAPCFSFTAWSVNASTRVLVSGVDVSAFGASAAAVRRARSALRTTNGLYARGRFVRTADGGTDFRALRLYLRAPLPRP